MRLRQSRVELTVAGVAQALLEEIDLFLGHAERQIDQIRRRVLLGQTIAHDEKVFSLFEPHTEWIVKGKAGVPVELGLRVAVVEDQYGFIVTHQVMEKTTDDHVAVPLIAGALAFLPQISRASFDKGFHSAANQAALAELINEPLLPTKGKCSAAERARESARRAGRGRRADGGRRLGVPLRAQRHIRYVAEGIGMPAARGK